MSRNESDLNKGQSATLPRPKGAGEQLPLFSAEALKVVRKDDTEWRRTQLDPLLAKKGAWKKDFTTISGMEVNPLATPADIANLDFERDLAFPGQFPYTRGVQPDHVPRPSLDDAPVRRLRYGEADERALPLSARARPDRPFDGLPPADALRLRLGSSDARAKSASAAWPSTRSRDMETIFEGIDLDRGHDSMTINSTAPILLAMYLAVAEKHGAAGRRSAAPSRTTSSRSTSPRRSTSFRRAPRCG